MTDFLPFFQKAMLLALLISLPSIVVATLIGTFVAIVQSVMQLQEQTLSFLFKLILVVLVLVLSANWMGREMFRYTVAVFDRISVSGRQ